MSELTNEVNVDQDTKIFREQIKTKMYLQEQNWNKEREMMAVDHSRRASLLKHYIETIDVAIKHIKEVEGFN